MADPWFRFYSAEFLLDEKINGLVLTAQAIVVRMWCVLHQKGTLPLDPAIVARLIGVNARTMQAHWDQVIGMFTVGPIIEPSTGDQRVINGSSTGDQRVITSSRLDRERRIGEERAAKHRMGAMKTNDQRWGTKGSLSDRLRREEIREEVQVLLPPITPPQEPESLRSPEQQKKPRGSRRPKVEKVDTLLEIPDVTPDDVKAGREIVALCPKEDPDGRKIHCDSREVVMRIVRIRERQPLFTPSVLVHAARGYYGKPRQRYKAAQYFLSLEPDERSGKPPFWELAAAEVSRRKLQDKSNPTPLPLE